MKFIIVLFCLFSASVLSEVAVNPNSQMVVVPTDSTSIVEIESESGSGDVEKKGTNKASVVVIPNDSENYLGDRVSFPINTKVGFYIGDDKKTCVLPYEKFKLFSDYKSLGFRLNSDNTRYLSIYSTKDIKCVGSEETITKYSEILVEPKDTLVMNRSGFTYGALLVPFKYYTRTNEFKGAASLGGYLGYRIDPSASFGIGVTPVIFGGGTAIEVAKDDSTTTLAGASYGLGFLGTVKREFEFGLILGWDRVSKSEDFDNNGKPWIAFSLGFDFSN